MLLLLLAWLPLLCLLRMPLGHRPERKLRSKHGCVAKLASQDGCAKTLTYFKGGDYPDSRDKSQENSAPPPCFGYPLKLILCSVWPLLTPDRACLWGSRGACGNVAGRTASDLRDCHPDVQNTAWQDLGGIGNNGFACGHACWNRRMYPVMRVVCLEPIRYRVQNLGTQRIDRAVQGEPILSTTTTTTIATTTTTTTQRGWCI